MVRDHTMILFQMGMCVMNVHLLKLVELWPLEQK